MNNKFYNVGNLGGTEGSAAAIAFGEAFPVIKFSNPGNSSINDYFDRQEFQMNNVGTNLIYHGLVDGFAVIENLYIKTLTITALGGITPILVFPTSYGGQQLIINYNFFVGEYNNDPDDPDYKKPFLSVDRMGTVKYTVQNGQLVDEYSYSIGGGTLFWRFDYIPNRGYYQITVQTAENSGRLELQTSLMR